MIIQGSNIIPALGYRVLYADPPWEFEAYSEDSGLARSPERHYDTLPLHEIIAFRERLDFGSILESDCVLHLWTSGTYLEMGMECLKGWGFQYKTAAFWRKIQAGFKGDLDKATQADEAMGMGYRKRSVAEVLLIGTRGKPGLPRKKFNNLFPARVAGHSVKPHSYYETIEAEHPGPYLELFARNIRAPRRNWVYWGDQALPFAA